MRDRNAWIGPLPSASRAFTLSVSFMPMMQKYSGSATRRAPASTASSMSCSASARLAGTLGPDAIWMAATRTVPACGAGFLTCAPLERATAGF